MNQGSSSTSILYTVRVHRHITYLYGYVNIHNHYMYSSAQILWTVYTSVSQGLVFNYKNQLTQLLVIVA